MKQYKITYQGTSYTGILQQAKGEKDTTPYLSLRESTRFLGFKHGQYTRRLLKEGKFDSPHRAIRVKEKNFSKWYISIPSLAAYQASRVVRESGRRYILRITQDDQVRVEEALTAAKITYTLELAYKKGQSKSKGGAAEVKPEELEEFAYTI